MSKHAPNAVIRLAQAGLVALLLTGCAMDTPPPLTDGAPVPLVKYDGSYQGRATLVSNTGGMCPAGRYGVLSVGDHTLNFAYQPDVIFVADVAEDGTVHDVAGTATLDGKITDGTLAMTVTTPTCQTSYSAGFVWNHS